MKVSTHTVNKRRPFFAFEIYDLQQDGFVNLVFGIFGKYLKFTWEFDGYIYKYRFEYATDRTRKDKDLRTPEQKNFWGNLKLWIDIKLGKKKVIGSWLYQKVEKSKISRTVTKYWNHNGTTNQQREKSLICIDGSYYELIDVWGIEFLKHKVTYFYVIENNKPAISKECGTNFVNNKFNNLKKAVDYANSWLGIQGPAPENWTGKPYVYNEYGDTISIVEIVE